MHIVFFFFTKSKTVINHSEKKTKDYSTATQFHTFIIFIADLNTYNLIVSFLIIYFLYYHSVLNCILCYLVNI